MSHTIAVAHVRRAMLVLALAAAPVLAQNNPQSTTAQVTARVFTPLSVVRNEDLRFGALFAPFAAKTIAFTDDAATGGRARFTLSGEGGAELALTIAVPSTIASGANTLAVGSFELRRHTVDANTGGTDEALVAGDNAVTLTLPGSAGASGSVFLRIRATATPGTGQAAGAYAGTITVTASYTGA